MAASKVGDIQPGDTFRLVDAHGNGVGATPIPAGALLTVRELVDAGTPGAHDDSEDAVVVEYLRDEIVYDADGNVSLGRQPQAFSLSASDVAELLTPADSEV